MSARRPAEVSLTRNQFRSVRRRTVGSLEDGRAAFLVRPGDTPEMVAAIFDNYDDALVPDAKPLLVEWCCHTSDYQYRNGCHEWCDRPSSRMVWTACYPEQIPDLSPEPVHVEPVPVAPGQIEAFA